MILHNPFTMNIAHTLASFILCIAVNELNQHRQKSMFILYILIDLLGLFEQPELYIGIYMQSVTEPQPTVSIGSLVAIARALC